MESAPSLSSLCNSSTQLGKIVRQQARKKDVIVTFCNYGFLDLTFNWSDDELVTGRLHNVQAMNITNFIVVALDDNAYHVLNRAGIPTCTLPRLEEVMWTEDGENFGPLGFKASPPPPFCRDP